MPLERKKTSRSESSLCTGISLLDRETNELWDLFIDRVGDSGFERLKCPKPDCAFYLPMYHLDAKPKIPMVSEPEARQWNQAPDPSIVEPFSWSGLKELSEFGLRPTPFQVFKKQPMEARLNCYPWLLVEHKKEGIPVNLVSCQAANGGACAVKLNQTAARYAAELPGDAHIAPFPTITTIGSHVKVWIMYFAQNFKARTERRFLDQMILKDQRRGYVRRRSKGSRVIKS